MRGLLTGAFLSGATAMGLSGCAVVVTVESPATQTTRTVKNLTLQETSDRCAELGGNVCASFNAKAQSDARILADYKSKQASGELSKIHACERAERTRNLDRKTPLIAACIDGINAGMGRQYITIRP